MIDADSGDFVLVKVSRQKFLAYVSDFDEGEGELELSVLHPKLPAASFHFPDELTTLVLPITQALAKVVLVSQEDNLFTFDHQSRRDIERFWPKKKKA